MYRAVDTRTSAIVAVKVFHGSDPDHARFVREAEILATLCHPKIVAYVAHGLTEEGAPYLAMEWLEGEDLATTLLQKPLAAEEALLVALQVAQGIAAAHATGILHRDLKPSNIFLVGGRTSDVRVIDFGIAHRPDLLTKLTMTGAILGTPAYMAPEQARGARHLTPAVDVFALGTVLFECLTGERAFNGDNGNAVLAQILTGETPRLARVKPDLPGSFDALVARMMAYKPLERFRDAATAALAISDVLADPSRPAIGPAPIAARPSLVSATLYLDPAEGAPPSELVACAERFGARVITSSSTPLLLATFELGTGAETARRAARCALEMLALAPSSRLAIVSERDATMPSKPEVFLTSEALAGVELAPGSVYVDAATVGHLGHSFEVRKLDHGGVLVGHRRAPNLLDDSPFVGRARELAAIDGLFAEVSGEECARVAIITGPAGIGKSHLLQVATRKLSANAAVLGAQADQPTSASPFEIVRSLVSKSNPSLLPSFETTSPGKDPVMLADMLRLSWLSFLEMELRARPVVLVVEDVHLADAASVRLLAAALAEFAERPLLLLGTARPDEESVLAPLEKYEPERIALRPLRAGAAADLVRSRLPGAAPGFVDRIVERASGVPLRIVALARAAAVDSVVLDDASTEGVLLRLDPDVLRAIRCASVFGMSFTVLGVAHLLGADETEDGAAGALAAAAHGEIVVARSSHTYSFANALLQETAYALLSEIDREAAHHRAGTWLSREPGVDPSIVAWHFERSGDPRLALSWYASAARIALVGGAATRALELTTAALACHPEGEELATLLLLHGEAAFAKADLRAGQEAAERALGLCAPGSRQWLRAAALLITSAGQAGDNDRVMSIGSLVHAQASSPKDGALRIASLCRASTQLSTSGRVAEAKRLLEKAEQTTTDDPDALAWLAHAQGVFALLDEDYPRTISLYRRSTDFHLAAGNPRASALLRVFVASVAIFSGDFARANAELDVVVPIARRTGADFYRQWARYTRSKIAALSGEPHAAREELAEVRRELAGHPRIAAGAHIYSALAALRAEDPAWAEGDARAALAMHDAPPVRAPALAALSLALGASPEALPLAREAMAIVDALGSLPENESVVHLALIEALLASGDHAGAEAALSRATSRLKRIAEKFADAPQREAFLYAIPVHARTLQLAARLGA